MKTYVSCYNTNMGIQQKCADFFQALKKLNITTVIDYQSNAKNCKSSYFVANNEVFAMINKIYTSNNKTICFTEDHALVAGIFKNLPENSGLVYVDAHADFHSWETSHSKRAHGMSLGTFMGLEGENLKGNVKPQDLIMIGVRDYENEEIENLRKLKINNVFGYDAQNGSFYNIFSKESISFENIIDLIKVIAKRTSAMGLSFDLDAIDSKEFNGAHYHVGNLPASVCKNLLSLTSNLYSLIEITELNTHNDNENDCDIVKSLVDII